LLGLAFLSGVSALIYESVWIRWFRVLLGSTTQASAVTLAVFFGGLALGAAWAARRAARSKRPLREYAWIELGVALAALWVPLALNLLEPWYPALRSACGERTGLFLVLEVALAAVAALPAAFLLGATLPLLATALLGERGELGRGASRLYALNTLGAAVGAALGALLLPEWIGVPATYAVALGTSLVVGAGAWFARAPLAVVEGQPHEPAPAARAAAGPLVLAAASGFAVLAFEVLLIHALGQLYSHCAYSLGLVLLVALVGLALGAALVARSAGRIASATLLRASLALTAVLIALTPWTQARFGQGVLLLGALIFVTAGLVFPLTFRLAAGGPAGARLGGLLACNTLGAIAGSLAASHLFLPATGVWRSLGALALVYALATAAVPGGWRARLAGVLPACVALLFVLLGPLSPWKRPDVRLAPGDTLLALERTPDGIVSVVESADGNRRIKIDDVYQFGGSSEHAVAERTGHLPLLLHPDPRTVAFVGSATGGVAGAAVLHPVERIDLVELIPAVQELGARYFAETNRSVHHDPRTRLVVEDGRNHLRTTATAYDVVVEDCFVPFQPGAASMYTRDHYQEVRARLTERGVFCQWLPVYQLDETNLRIIAATFESVFPGATLWRPHLRPQFPVVGLIGFAGPPPALSELTARTEELHRLGLHDRFVTDARHLWLLHVGAVAQLFAESPRPRPHSDVRPYFEFVSSRTPGHALDAFRYQGWPRLCDTLARRAPTPDEPFADRPHALALGGNALLRANLAQAGGSDHHVRQSWAEVLRHLPPDVLLVRDPSFSGLW